MKRKITIGLVAFTLTIGIIGCNKKNIEPTQENVIEKDFNKSQSNRTFEGVNMTGSTIEFETIDYYESIVDNEDYTMVDDLIKTINSSNFQSFGKLFPEDDIFEDDDFTNAILDINSIVKIGNWYLKVNVEDGNVLMIKDEVNDAYNELVSESNNQIKSLPFTEDVLDYLRDEKLFEGAWWNGCEEEGGPWATVPHSWDVYCDPYEFKFKSSYWTIGFWKVLKLAFYHNELGGSDDATEFSIGYRYAWKKKCKETTGHGQVNMVGYYKYNDDCKKLKFYQGVRSLSRYYIGNAYLTAGPTVKFKNKCTGYASTITLVNKLIHGY